MFRPDPDFFDSGDSASYHQDLSFIPTFSYPSSSPVHPQHQRSGLYSGSLPLGPPMSTRQNKKQRKSRNNAMNRERTVTTLTEDPNTPYLVPLPSEEPAGSHMAAPFSGSGGKMHNNIPMGPPHSYPMQNNFGGYGFTGAAFGSMPHMHSQQQQPPHQHQNQPPQQQQFFSSPPQQHNNQPQQRVPVPDVRPKVALPPGKNDLEILQNLKKLIIDNQHPVYKAVPSPMSLARLYKGTIPTQSQQTGRRGEQAPSDHRNDSADGQPPVTSTPTSGFNQPAGEYGDRRQRGRPQGGKDRRAGPVGPSGNQQNNPSQANQGARYNNAPGGNSLGSLNTQNLKISKNNSGPPSAGVQPESQSSDLTSGGPTQPVPEGQRRGYEYSSRYSKSESTASGQPSDASYDKIATDVPMTDKGPVYIGKDDTSRPGHWDPRDIAHSHDDREFDSERTTTPRPPLIAGSVDTRPVGGPDRGPGTDGYDRTQDHGGRRGDWNDRHPDRGRDTRLTDNRRSSSVAEQRHYEAEFGQPPVRRDPPLTPDARHLSDNPPAGDVRPPVDARPPPDTRVDARAAPARTNERLGLDTEDIQSSRSSSVRPTDAPAPLGSVPPAAPGGDIVDDPSLRPSLKERLNPARTSRTPTEASMGAGEQHPPHYTQDRSRRPNKYRGNHNTHGGPPYDDSRRNNFGRPVSPPADDAPPSNAIPGGPPPARRSFVPREGRKNLSPASRGGHRDYVDHRGPPGPPGRSVSRDRGGYRPDFHDPRYPGGVDPEASRYEGRPYREFSPSLSGGRGPPPDAPPGRDYHQYPPAGRREWGGPHEEEEYYKSRGWDGPPDRGRYERDYPPPSRAGGWDGRPDRDYPARDAYPPGPPGPPPDERYPPGPVPVREADRTRPPPSGGYGAPFSRVRPRSPSPPRRPGPGAVDDPRPPIKRPREDFGDYYNGGGGRDPMRRPPAEYPHPPPRAGSQGPPNSGWAPPPASGSSAGGGGGPPSDRDYRMGRDSMDYGPPPGGAYDRRSPGPPGPPGGRMPYNRGGGGGYGRGGGEPRDRGGYGMQRP